MDLVLFPEAIEHLIRLLRILRMPQSHALLIGMIGQGRKSITLIAGYLMNLATQQIVLNKNYKEQNWKDDIRKLLKQTGGKCIPTLFIFSDQHIAKEN